MSVMTFDLEVQTEVLHKRKASPFNPNNYIVAAGFKINDGDTYGDYYSKAQEIDFVIPDHVDTLVGFNIKFDLLWTRKHPSIVAFFKRGGKIWDCQYVEYLLEGMHRGVQMCSMDSIIEKYGGSLKIDAVKELWNQGVNTSDIDPDLLMTYLLGDGKGIAGDVNNTYSIYEGQLKKAKEIHPNFIKMIELRMDGLLFTTECEYNGIYVDTELAEKNREQLAKEVETLEVELLNHLPKMPDECKFNWSSIYDKSYVIYGGAKKYEKWVQHTDEAGVLLFAKKSEKWPLCGDIARPLDECILHTNGLYEWNGIQQDAYKSGKRKGEGKFRSQDVPDYEKPKGAKQTFLFDFAGFAKPNSKHKSTLTDGRGKPIYSTAGDIIEELAATQGNDFLIQLLERNQKVKDLGTYYWQEDSQGKRKGMMTLINDDNIIHHSLNHTLTVTGRLSSSNPNMQNIPRGDKSSVKAMFKSRFGDEGVMGEIDYTSLEVVGQQVITGDKQLATDLNNKIDFHCKRAALANSLSYEEVLAGKDDKYKLIRQNAKVFSFQRAYGAGAHKIALTTGMTVEAVEALIAAEDKEYPMLSFFDRKLEQQIIASSQETNMEVFIEGQRFSIHKGEWFAPTGTRYVWLEQEAPKFMQDKGTFLSFSPTERKNYPVQGFSGEVVQAMIGKLFRLFQKNGNYGGKAFLVNTVHDCVWVDVHKSVARQVLNEVSQVLEAVPQLYNKTFNLGITVPFPVEAEVGNDMLNMIHFKR